MKCINCYKNAVKENPDFNNINEVVYYRQVSGTRDFPLFQRRRLVCEQCGKTVNTLETIKNVPQITIDGEDYFKLKHIMSILEVLGSRKEHVNYALEIVDEFMSECYQEAYKNPKGNSPYAKTIERSKYNITRFTYERLKDLVTKNKKWGVDENCAAIYACNHDFQVLVDCVIK